MASAHYSTKVLEYLKSQKVAYVLKAVNPANLPKANPIEDFWTNLKAKVYEGDLKYKTLVELKKRIQQCLRKMNLKFVQNDAKGVKKRLDQIRSHGYE